MNERIRDYCVTPGGCRKGGCIGDCLRGFRDECDRRAKAAADEYHAERAQPMSFPELDALSMQAQPEREARTYTMADYTGAWGEAEMARIVANREREEQPATKGTNPKDAIGVRKAPLSTVPMNVIAEVGVAMMEGALKYGRHNYRGEGVRASVYFDGNLRHLIDWWEGVDIDPDSGLNHIIKAITGLVVLRDSMLQGNWVDDRPPKSKPFYPELNARAAALMDKHADKNPHHYTEREDGGEKGKA